MPPITRSQKRLQVEETTDRGKKPRTSSARASPASTTPTTLVAFNALCSLCKALLSEAGAGSAIKKRRFYTPEALVQSAAKHCHICTLLLDALHKQGNPPDSLNATTQLTVEARYYQDHGISIVLFRRRGYPSLIAYVDLHFRNARKVENLSLISSTHTRSQESWNHVEHWIKRCVDEHTSCQAHIQAIPSGEAPTRILDVGAIENEGIRLCETSILESSTMKYATLSHCWGGIIPTRLLRDNYDLFLGGITMNQLPRTFRDAIEVTRKLVLRYLWIDSLCIIQDDPVDWQKQAARMRQVYRYSYLTLAAAASPDSRCGLFFPRSPLSIVPCRVQVGHGAHLRYVGSSYSSELEAHPKSEIILLSRAWVLQEWILSPRILVFGQKELHWVCKERVGNEMIPVVPESSDETSFSSLEDMPWISLRKSWDNPCVGDQHQYAKIWNQVVSSYSATRVTKSSDRLVAISGLVSDFSSVWNGGTYLAGLWSHWLRQDLLWRTEKPELRSQCVYIAPSWSWASVDSPVIPADHYEAREYLVEVLDANTQLATSLNSFGAITDGLVRLKGPMPRTTITKVPQGPWRVDLMKTKEDAELQDFPYRAEVNASVYWDDKRLDTLIEGATVTLVPFEVYLSDSFLGLRGLVLEPTFAHNGQGQYRRLGYFYITDMWREHKTDFNKILPKILIPYEVSEDSGSSDFSSDSDGISPSSRGRLPTALEIEALFNMADEDRYHVSRDELQQKRNLEQRMLSKRLSSDNTKSEDTDRKDDSTEDRELDMTLIDRYEDELTREDYPNINSFLSLTQAHSEIPQSKGTLNPELYQAYHGQGFFTFEIV